MWREATIAIALAASIAAVQAEDAATRDAAFLAEVVCDGGASAFTPIVLAAECSSPRLRRGEDVVTFQRHDWPAQREAATRPQGYQRSVSYVAGTASGKLAVVQTFDFGGGDRSFGRFDAGKGDGGQVATLSGGVVHVAMTEDGSGGIQWFTGSACRSDVDPLRSGWLLFDRARDNGWRTSVAELRITRSATDCPTAFDRSYTRWRETTADWPALFDGRLDTARPFLAGIRTIVSEHFGRENADRADHMERFFLAEGMGLVRWERWEQAGLSKRPDIESRAMTLAASGRCPEVAASGSPGEAWRRIDCRTWTNFVSSPGKAASFGWPQSEGVR